ncbi:uncharacterized protein PgNI_01756 [Pyricularia grisea]|uniref:Uncharacterized protein n=1 Tax=Pyricularia grisea TaxID=148305 RepID=A0A6P8BMA1_PYRGI|nr:uncharacterized protein PgNI_01756 [Pyricularia grisea]TLD17687.1 hypothetical protein PgNI_01756 [Pyricularia grisea]
MPRVKLAACQIGDGSNAERGKNEQKESGPARDRCTYSTGSYLQIQGGTAVQGGVARQENVVCALAAAGKRGCEIC